jgi:hypothetical protein
MRKGLSEYEIEGRVAWLRGTLILPSVESGRCDEGGGMNGALSLYAWRRDQGRRHLPNMGSSTSGIRERSRWFTA